MLTWCSPIRVKPRCSGVGLNAGNAVGLAAVDPLLPHCDSRFANVIVGDELSEHFVCSDVADLNELLRGVISLEDVNDGADARVFPASRKLSADREACNHGHLPIEVSGCSRYGVCHG